MTQELRPTPSLDAPDTVRLSLQDWLTESVYPNRKLIIPAIVIPENTGMSNITLLFDCVLDDQETMPMVARLQAQGDKLAFPEYNLPMQYAAMEALGKISGLQLPQLVAQEPSGEILGTPFYIMQRCDGRIPPDMPPYHMDGWLLDASPADRKALWNSAISMIATLHAQDPTAAPLAEFVQQYNFPKSLDEQLRYWEHYMAWGLEGAHNEACEQALAWLRQHQPEEQCLRLCWGDSRMANVIFDPTKNEIAALLDWEMLCMGDPLQDIAWWIFMDEVFSHGIGIPRLEGFPDIDTSAQLWSTLSGHKYDKLHYYRVYAGMRISLILARMSLATDGSMVEDSFASQYTLKVMSEKN